ncbi:agmatine deiminase family protein [Streptomyces sp. SDr-06]|uniref:agmatine deiminase family protein n=1 Tax=Streptomyces sp. SDr-06 TaxID=2267702 RepID=UPI001CB929A0
MTSRSQHRPRSRDASSRAAMKHLLVAYLGVTRTLWIEWGSIDDATRNHVNNMTSFTAPGTACLTWADDTSDAQYGRGARPGSPEPRSGRPSRPLPVGELPLHCSTPDPGGQEGAGWPAWRASWAGEGRPGLGYGAFRLGVGGCECSRHARLGRGVCARWQSDYTACRGVAAGLPAPTVESGGETPICPPLQRRAYRMVWVSQLVAQYQWWACQKFQAPTGLP